MQVSVHIGSLALGVAVGTAMSLLGALAVGPWLFPHEPPVDNTVLIAGLERCRDKLPLYVSRIGAITSVKCNGHREVGAQ